MSLGELGQRPAVRRDRVGFLPGELLSPRQPQEQVLVVEILGAETGQRDLERLDRLRVVTLGLPRVRDAALTQRLDRLRWYLPDGQLPGAARLGVLLRVVAQVAELVGELRGARARGLLREG